MAVKTEKNSCGIARFPCSRTAFLLLLTPELFSVLSTQGRRVNTVSQYKTDYLSDPNSTTKSNCQNSEYWDGYDSLIFPSARDTYELSLCQWSTAHITRVWPFGITWRHRSRDYLIPRRPFPIVGPFETKPLSLAVFEIFNIECNSMVDMRPLNKGQSHSFW